VSSRKTDTQEDKDVRETPQDLLIELDAEFSFTLDAASTHQNAVCDLHYTELGLFNGETMLSALDGLTGPWDGENVWCNPPYSEIEAWVAKAWQEWDRPVEDGRPGCIVMLLPANRTEQPWWAAMVEPRRDGRGPLRTRFIEGRRHFTVNGGQPIINKKTGKKSSPDFGLVLLVWK
jgi:phage N-6-adenine-methyltransferase